MATKISHVGEVFSYYMAGIIFIYIPQLNRRGRNSRRNLMRGAKLWFTRPGIRQMYIGVRIKPHLILSLKVENILKYDSMATFQTNADYYKAAPNFEPTQPNPTEKVGRATKKADCVVRAFSIVTGYSWLESFDILAENARRTYNMINDPLNYYEVFRERGYKEYTEKAVKGQKRLTVEQFAQQHPTGRYLVKVASHLTAVIDGVIKDAWNTSNEVVYKYFEVC